MESIDAAAKSMLRLDTSSLVHGLHESGKIKYPNIILNYAQILVALSIMLYH